MAAVNSETKCTFALNIPTGSFQTKFNSFRVEGGGFLTDVTLASRGQYIRCHKLVLSCSSSFFQDIFMKNDCENRNTIVILESISPKVLQSVVELLYVGIVDIASADLKEFREACNMVKINLTEVAGAVKHQLSKNSGSAADDNVTVTRILDEVDQFERRTKSPLNHSDLLYERTPGALGRNNNSTIALNPASIDYIKQHERVVLPATEKMESFQPLNLLTGSFFGCAQDTSRSEYLSTQQGSRKNTEPKNENQAVPFAQPATPPCIQRTPSGPLFSVGNIETFASTPSSGVSKAAVYMYFTQFSCLREKSGSKKIMRYKCNLCEALLGETYPNTGNLKAHLQRRHRAAFENLQRIINEKRIQKIRRNLTQ